MSAVFSNPIFSSSRLLRISSSATPPPTSPTGLACNSHSKQIAPLLLRLDLFGPRVVLRVCAISLLRSCMAPIRVPCLTFGSLPLARMEQSNEFTSLLAHTTSCRPYDSFTCLLIRRSSNYISYTAPWLQSDLSCLRYLAERDGLTYLALRQYSVNKNRRFATHLKVEHYFLARRRADPTFQSSHWRLASA